ncbi:putative bifunctional diguanylate cyclase/phosphodiesterase [Cellulomonas sp. 179-A 4D5 NHS]|uniref:putative bifunctional diguanylate cyclase/phosphodiesterase n=1 Tax=Cellulomonas sp. 179-A 4D5 NHS TaxID=3142378 RepID=UPI00399F3BCA
MTQIPDGDVVAGVDAGAMLSLLDELSATVTGDFSVQDILQQLAEGVTDLLGLAGAGVSTPSRTGELLVVAYATQRRVEQLDRVQEALQAGPAPDAHVSGRVVASRDLRVEGAWPHFQQRATELGLPSVTAVPLRARGEALGVLTLYRSEPVGLGRGELAAVRTLANLAASYLVVAIDREAAAQAQGELAHQAAHDPLTGLPTRRVFFEQLDEALTLVRRDLSTVGVLFIDVDGLKRVNDTYGHALGDQLLLTCAERIRAALRPDDLLARLAGDEFVVVLEHLASADVACTVAQRICDSLALPMLTEGHLLQPSASIGIAVSDEPGVTSDLLVSQADAAMYRAKRRRKGSFQLFDPVVHASEQAEAISYEQLSSELETAIRDEQLEVHYQPILEIMDPRIGSARPDPLAAPGALYAVEALVRWRHPRHGLLSAGAFIGAAVRSGLIVELGAWVLRTACRQLVTWDAVLGRRAPRRLFVNVSPAELSDPGLLERITRDLSAAGLAGDRLTLEITENGPLDSSTFPAEVIDGLRRLGCHLAIDDFGTGHSTLGRVVEIPASVLKIDQSFTSALPGSVESAAVISSALLLGHNLRRTVVVEGVETEEALRALQELGTTHFQGFHLALPQHPDALTDAILESAGTGERRSVGRIGA